MLAYAAVAPHAHAVTVAESTVLEVTASTAFAGLVMEGGWMRIGDPVAGGALTIDVSGVASLKRGTIDLWYSNQTGSTINFLDGAHLFDGAGPMPPLGVAFQANPFNSQGLTVNNFGTFTQSGNGQINLLGSTRFVNNASATFAIANDGGIPADFARRASFFNASGATFVKYAGVGTSNVDVPFDQHGGRVELWSGQLAFNAGGFHDDARFHGAAGGPNPGGVITFAGAHTFASTGGGNGVTTQGGAFLLAPGGRINVWFWTQAASFRNEGVINLHAPGTALINEGELVSANAGALMGMGTLQNQPAGVYRGNVLPHPGDSTQRVTVINYGEFTVPSGGIAQVAQFRQESGRLTVDGELETATLTLLGGELRGGGLINGDVFVGGGPGTASFNPGSSPGTLIVNGSFHLLVGGVLELEVEALPGGGLAFDRIVVSGGIRLNGHVRLHIGTGVSAADAAALRFFDCGGPCSIDYGNGSGFGWSFPNRPGSLLTAGPEGLAVTHLAAEIPAVPEPETYALLLAGLGMVVAVSRRRPLARARVPAVRKRS